MYPCGKDCQETTLKITDFGAWQCGIFFHSINCTLFKKILYSLNKKLIRQKPTTQYKNRIEELIEDMFLLIVKK